MRAVQTLTRFAAQYRTLIIIPCFNEEASIARVLEECRASVPACDTVVVDDGSKDNTTKVASRYTEVLRLPANLGIGGAVQTGLKYAERMGYDFAVQIDGDGQHPPQELSKLFDCYEAKKANLTIGSRFIDGSGFQSTLIRRAGIGVLRFMVRRLTGSGLSDPTSGLRLFDRAAIEYFSREYPRDYPEPVSCVLAHEKGLSMEEVPVLMRERSGGVSSIPPLAYMIRVCCYLLLIRMRRYI
jgi:glycosyltransferase involved in cell wall biosynthesis